MDHEGRESGIELDGPVQSALPLLVPIRNLADADLLDPHALAQVDGEELQQLIRPAGYYRLKTKRLLHLVRFFERYDGDLDAMFSVSLGTLREELLSLNGIGPETADSILLYAGGLPTFVGGRGACPGKRPDRR